MSDVLISARARTAEVYHTDPEECWRVPEDTLSVTLENAHARGLRECSVCADDVESVDENRPALRTLIARGEVDL